MVWTTPLADHPGFEPGTLELTALCSAVELMVIVPLDALGLGVRSYCRKPQRDVIDTFVLQGSCLRQYQCTYGSTEINFVKELSETYFPAASAVASEVVFGSKPKIDEAMLNLSFAIDTK